VRDDAIALVREEDHLRLEAVRVQRPAVAERDDRTILRAPVLEVELHAVRGGDRAAVEFAGRRVGAGGESQCDDESRGRLGECLGHVDFSSQVV
jgi:hypothetical protein